MWKELVARILTRENLLAFLLALLLVAVLIFTTDTTAAWIYQGF
jgi:hypothetical protein